MVTDLSMSDYLLGHSDREWSRLAEQHHLWRDTLLEHLPDLEGASVLEVGCGNGMLLADLAARVGPGGRCVGIERDPAAAAQARARVPTATLHQGDLRLLPLGGPHDVIVARWVLSFLPDPAEIIVRLAGALGLGVLFFVNNMLQSDIDEIIDATTNVRPKAKTGWQEESVM